MTVTARPTPYPQQDVSVQSFSSALGTLFPRPHGVPEGDWPPLQIKYIGHYLERLECKTVVVEKHYVDRDYIHDMSVFYARSLRDYPNYCRRLHFFNSEFDAVRWRALVIAHSAEDRGSIQARLQQSYLGFLVARPLPGSPVGRTVLRSFGPTGEGFRREFGPLRDYPVHLGSYTLQVTGLAFQAQDRGTSACATTALWSALNRTAWSERLPVPAPAEITESASRYFLSGGRALPSEGLTPQQLCEATRAAGLAPLLIGAVSLEHDRAQILGYLASGFAPVLTVRSLDGMTGHAVCAVGVKVTEVAPQSNPNLHFRDASTAVASVYVHDDRLGPYAIADLYPYTMPEGVRTGLRIRWPRSSDEFEHQILTGLVVPVPMKLRLTLTRLRALGMEIADAIAQLLPELDRKVVLNCRYRMAAEYRGAAPTFGLSEDGLFRLVCETVLSRFVGVIEIAHGSTPLLDVLLDTTDTEPNPSVLGCVRREGLADGHQTLLETLTEVLGGRAIY